MVKPSGVVFRVTAFYAAAGCFSGFVQGGEWIRTANDVGVANWQMMLPAAGLLVAAVCGRVALRLGGRHGGMVEYCSLLCWAAVFGAAALSVTGLHGLLGDSILLSIAHILAQGAAGVFGSLATIKTMAMVRKFDKMATADPSPSRAAALALFRLPGSLLYAASLCAIILIAMNIVSPETAHPVAWSVLSVALTGALLRIATLFPYKPERTIRGQQHVPR